MNPIAILHTNQPELSFQTVILWNDNERIIAAAYNGIRPQRTQTLDATTLVQAVQETKASFGIQQAELTRIDEHATILTGTPSSRWD